MRLRRLYVKARRSLIFCEDRRTTNTGGAQRTAWSIDAGFRLANQRTPHLKSTTPEAQVFEHCTKFNWTSGASLLLLPSAKSSAPRDFVSGFIPLLKNRPTHKKFLE